MDGSTWCNYRFVTDAGDRPRFWMEPDNPPEWPRQFVRGGFRALAGYFSALDSQLAGRSERLEQVTRRLTATGVTLRPVCSRAFEADLRRIHHVACTAFRHNLLYSELRESDFLARSRPLRDFAPLQLSWLAEQDGTPVGFVFAVPDLCERSRQSRIDTVIIKTLAVVPDRIYAGLGQLLLAVTNERARQQGYSAAIHALVHDVGPLHRLSARYARIMRRYTLFAKVLLP
jgi:GNAT superfamily N-acetyltransferase